jgi:hypothetical protein
MRRALLAGIAGIALAVVFDLLWINLFAAGVGGLLLGVFWMPVLALALLASRTVRADWTSILPFAIAYTPTQFVIRAYVHEPATRWPANDMLVLVWSNFWLAVMVGAVAAALWRHRLRRGAAETAHGR